MGFDPRQWPSAAPQQRRVTTNLDALLAENAELRREVQQLRRRLALLERPAATARRATAAEAPAPRVSPQQVRHWSEALAAQSGWRELRLGGDGNGLQAVLDDLNQRSFQPALSLEQRLDRLVPGLGRDLVQALGTGAPTRTRLAIQAAFCLYGLSAIEWLDDAPARVVQELRQRQQQLDQRGPRASGQRQRGQRRRSSAAPPAGEGDSRRLAALRVLGLEWGATREAIKTAHRRLVKQHHPDMGGRTEDFHRINDAYQQLMA